MANSSIVTSLKDKVIAELINDETLFHAINSPDIKNFEDSHELLGTHIFRYNQNPNTLEKEISFLTVQVQIPESFNRNTSNRTLITARLEIWIYSHERVMNVKNIPKISDNRNDYIAKLIDKKLNGRNLFGLPEDKNPLSTLSLVLVNNIEGAFINNYLFRQLIFETKDLNNSLCSGNF